MAVAVTAVSPALGEDGSAGIPLPPPPRVGVQGDCGGADGSAEGYPNASPGEAEDLFTDDFSCTVDSLASDPPDLSGEHPIFLNDHTAVISADGSPSGVVEQIEAALERNQHDGEAAQAEIDAILSQARSEDDSVEVVASTLPLRATDDSGHEGPVDLSLEAQGQGYRPENPLVDLTLPDDLDDDVAIGDQGISIDIGTTESGSASPMGGEGLFYADAAPATDVVLAPLSTGLETFYQLRAPDSPEHFEMSFTLPEGASLEESGDGGAQVVQGDQTLASIYPPAAQDAASNPVAVTMTVNGDSLEVDVPHSDPEIAYPINVDPVIDTYTWSTNGAGTFSHWIQNKTVGSPYQLKTVCTTNVNCTSGSSGLTGLYVAVPQNAVVADESLGAWHYRVPRYGSTTAYISNLSLGPMYFADRGDTNNNPFLFAGIYADSSGSYLANRSQGDPAGNLYWSLSPGSSLSGKQGVFGLWSWAARTVTKWRDAYLGGATVTLGDLESPTISLPSPTGITFNANGYSNWVDSTTPTWSASATDQDPSATNGGLGVNRFQFSIPYTSGAGDQAVNMWCTGANASPCPVSASSGAIGFDTSRMPSGVTVIGVTATDALSKADTRIRKVRVDHARPRITLSGGLAPGGGTGPYTLHIDATDGDTSAESNWQSGVRQITVKVNGNPVTVPSSGPQNCTRDSGSCPLSVDYTMNAYDYETSNLQIEVDATDQLGHHGLGATQPLAWTVPLPNTSITGGPAASSFTSDATPSFTYSSSISGSTFDCRIDNAPMAACPASGFTAPQLANGQHTFYVRATDPDGHLDTTSATRTFTVDTQAPSASVDSGPSGLTFDARPTFGFSSTDGSATFSCSIDTGTPDFGNCSGSGVHRPPQELGNGSHTFRVKATDPAGNLSTATRAFQLSNPTLDVSGRLVDGDNPLVGADPITDFIATDTGSGVTSVKLLVDNQVMAEEPQDCPGGGCSLEGSLEPDLSELTPGPHTYKAVASNANGITKHVSGTFRLDPGGPLLELTGALADANGQPLATATAGLAIRAIDNAPGDTGIANVEVAVDDDPAATANPSCGQSCPADYTTSYTYRKVDWGPGAHTVTVTTTDAAGNASETTLDVDGTVEDSVTCPTVSQTVQDPVNVVSTATAQAQAPAAALAPTQPTTDPDDPEAAIDPSLSEPAQTPPTPLSSTESLASDEVASLPADGFKVNDSVCLVPTQTTPAETNAALVAGDSALYANSAQETDTIVRPTAAGEAVIASRRGPSAPTSFSWQVGLPSGMQLQELSGGGVAIIDPALPASLPPPTSGPPAGSQSPSAIADAATQLAAERYWVAAAQQETGKYVDAVIRPPFAINAQGQSSAATLAISAPNRVTLNVPSGSAAGVMAVDSNDQEAKKSELLDWTWGGPGLEDEQCAQMRVVMERGKHFGGHAKAVLRRLEYMYNASCSQEVPVPAGWLKARYIMKVRYNGAWHACRSVDFKRNARQDSKVINTSKNYIFPPCGEHPYKTEGIFRIRRGGSHGPLSPSFHSPRVNIRGR